MSKLQALNQRIHYRYHSRVYCTFFSNEGHFFCFMLTSVHHTHPYLCFFLSFLHSFFPSKFPSFFFLTIPIYPSLCLDLLVNPLAFAIFVASFTFPSFLPSRKRSNDKHDARSTNCLSRGLQGLQLVMDAFQSLSAFCVKGGHILFVGRVVV